MMSPRELCILAAVVAGSMAFVVGAVIFAERVRIR